MSNMTTLQSYRNKGRPLPKLKAIKAVVPVSQRKEQQSYALEARLYMSEQVVANLERMVKAMITKAIDGDVNAFNSLMDRVAGKPAQALEVSGEGGQPIVFMPLELMAKHGLEQAQPIQATETTYSVQYKA